MYRATRARLRKLMQSIGRRWPDPALVEDLQSLRLRLDNLCLVMSPPEGDGEIVHELPDGTGRRRLYRSGFNIAWLEEFAIVPQVIFDIGCYDGGDSVRFKRSFPQAKVVAFEADPERYAVVCRNAAGLGIRALNAAVCDRDGPVSWYQSKDARFTEESAGSQGSMYRHSAEYRQQHDGIRQSAVAITVNGVRLDTVCRDIGVGEVDLAHIDVEGAEYDVLGGLGDIRPKLIYLETVSFGAWIGARETKDVHRKLSSLGYVMAADLPGNRLYVRADVARHLRDVRS
jgi:FkbM family methyltransferase